MMVRRLPVLLMVMLVGIVGSQRPGDEMPKFPVHGKEMEETKSAEKILIDKDPEFKKHLEDVEKNGELMEKECFNGYCFEVKQLRRFYNDRDCCCPT
ncbi:hypothetical protein LSH36_437g00022 [Paralvinella palmiformis]|uniref:Uncharacterized protein n=1 Tax=Paralvinella palmiformis TaxID=53620 RepID=A0AAD9MY53_9ANNE|nr:hypothetical protein LSH36_437g00022 [Paralvinella palmiformis]